MGSSRQSAQEGVITFGHMHGLRCGFGGSFSVYLIHDLSK